MLHLHLLQLDLHAVLTERLKGTVGSTSYPVLLLAERGAGATTRYRPCPRLSMLAELLARTQYSTLFERPGCTR